MARHYGDYPARGARIAGIVIDKPGQNAAIVQKLALPFPIFSDPDGSQSIKPFDVWDRKGAMSLPATIALGPDGSERYRYVGVDLVDRPVYEEALAEIAKLDLEPLPDPIEVAQAMEPSPGARATTLDYLQAYMRGVRSSTNELAGRLKDEWDRAECARTARMAERFIAELAETQRIVNRAS